MYQSVDFNIYEEHLENVVFGKIGHQEKPRVRANEKVSNNGTTIPKPVSNLQQNTSVNLKQNQTF